MPLRSHSVRKATALTVRPMRERGDDPRERHPPGAEAGGRRAAGRPRARS